MRHPRRLQGGLLGLLLTLAVVGLCVGCSTSDKIVQLPPPAGLPSLTELEKHLDYRDPDDGKPDYIPRRAR